MCYHGGMSAFDEQAGELEIRKVLERHSISVENMDLLVEEICNVRRLMPAQKYPTPIKIELKEDEIDSEQYYDISMPFEHKAVISGDDDEITISGSVRGEYLVYLLNRIKA